MKVIVLLAVSALACTADTIEAFGLKWTVPISADWKVEKDGTGDVLRMLVGRPSTQPRRPTQFALAETAPYRKVTIEADAKRIGGSLIIVYAYKDANHFNYAHLSVDAPAKQPVHNGIFHVYGGDRVRISNEEGPGSLPSAEEWYRLKLEFDGTTGKVNVTVNGKAFPSLVGVDLSLTSGKVGIGSFFETAIFKNVKITGETGSTLSSKLQ